MKKKLLYISILSVLILAGCMWFFRNTLVEALRGDKNTDILSPIAKNQKETQHVARDTDFSDKKMNLVFQYPKIFQLTKVNDQAIFISKDKTSSVDDGLLVYATTLQNGSKNLTIPFSLPGKLQKSLPIPKKNFIAREDMYSDGKHEIDLLILQHQQQFFIMRIPQNSKLFTDAITEFIDSIKTLN